MSDAPEVNVEVINPEPTAEATAETVIDAAVVIAEKIDEARQEGHTAEELVNRAEITIEIVMGEVKSVNDRLGILTDLVMGLIDQVAGLAAIEVAEIIEENTDAEVDEIIDTAEEISDDAANVQPPKEVVETATTPQIRSTKKTKWL